MRNHKLGGLYTDLSSTRKEQFWPASTKRGTQVCPLLINRAPQHTAGQLGAQGTWKYPKRAAFAEETPGEGKRKPSFWIIELRLQSEWLPASGTAGDQSLK